MSSYVWWNVLLGLTNNPTQWFGCTVVVRRHRRHRLLIRLSTRPRTDVRFPVRELVLLPPVRRVLAEGPEAAAPAVDDHDDDQAVHWPARREVPAGGHALAEKPQPREEREG